MSTYSTNLALTLIGNGEQSGLWGTTTNTNLGTLIEQAISGYVEYACTGGTDTITIPNGATGIARNMYLELTGTGGGNLIVPANKKLYFVYNNTGSGDVTVKVSGQTGVAVPNGSRTVLVSNGTDIVNAITYIPLDVANLTVTNLTATTGTVTTVNATTVNIGSFSLSVVGGKLTVKNGATVIATLSSAGVLTTLGDIVSDDTLT